MSWHGETNPHFWPRDPPQPSFDQPGPSRPKPSHICLPPPVEPVPTGPVIHSPERRSKPDHVRLPSAPEPIAPGSRIHSPERRSKPGHVRLPQAPEPIASGSRIRSPEERRPWWKSKPKEQPSHVRLPPAVAPIALGPPGRKLKHKDRGRQPRQQAQPEYELTPTSHDPELLVPPTSKDHWPMHPHEASHDHWPLHPNQLSQDGQTTQPHPQPHPRPHVGLVSDRPPPHRQPDHRPLDPHQASQDGPPTQPHPHPRRHDQQPHTMPVPIPVPSRPRPKRQDELPPQPRPHPKKQHQPHHIRPPIGRPPHVRPTEEGGQPYPHRDQDLIYPSPHRTNPCTWFIAVFCVILWVVIILGGILILIIYLLYRPRSPHFEISDASLNAAYLDMGYLLNADLTLLVNFTNPNRKMSVDFNFIVLKLRYENHLIANQYIEPFEAGRLEHKFARVEMVGSQVRLPVLVTQQLVKQIQGNRITFELDGYFHARSRLGGIFRYSYWLYTHCTIITRGPPSGVVVFAKCITKR